MTSSQDLIFHFQSEVGHYVPGLHFKDEFNTENAGEGNEITIGKKTCSTIT